MEPLLMIESATGLLAVSALGGLAMAGIRLAGMPQPPSALAMLHGFHSASALTLLIYAWFTTGLPGIAQIAVVLFVPAAAGGILMNLGYHWKMQPLPIPLMLGHAGIAVCGFELLVVSTIGMARVGSAPANATCW